MSAEKRLIMVLGMHRSGTSALTKGLAALGVDLGSDLMPACPHNPTGYWEDMGFYGFNEELLKALNRRWDDMGFVELDELLELSAGSLFSRAVAFVRDRLGGRALLGVKDPRFALLLPFWEKVFEVAEIRVSYVVSFRNPLSVAASLASRNDMPKTQALWLWVMHNARIISSMAKVESLVVDYDELLDAPAVQLARMARFLELPVKQESLAVFAAEFLDVGLRHTRYSVDEIKADSDCATLVIELYEALRLQALADSACEAGIWRRLDSQFQIALSQVRGLLNLNSGLMVRCRELEARCAQLAVENTGLEARSVHAEKRIERIQGSLGWKLWKTIERLRFCDISLWLMTAWEASERLVSGPSFL